MDDMRPQSRSQEEARPRERAHRVNNGVGIELGRAVP